MGEGETFDHVRMLGRESLFDPTDFRIMILATPVWGLRNSALSASAIPSIRDSAIIDFIGQRPEHATKGQRSPSPDLTAPLLWRRVPNPCCSAQRRFSICFGVWTFANVHRVSDCTLHIAHCTVLILLILKWSSMSNE